MADNETDLEVSDVVAAVHAAFREARDKLSEWREAAKLAYDMEAGTQWTDDDIESLKEQNRPAVTFNRIARTINTVIGTQISNRQDTRFLPRTPAETAVTEMLDGACSYIREQCEAEDEESDAFEDMAVCGVGCIETRLDYETDPDGAILIERVDPMDMYWDTSATKRNLSDARWVMHIRTMSIEEFEAEFPEADIANLGDPWDAPADVNTRNFVLPQDAYKYNQATSGGRPGKKEIKVARYQYAEKVPVYRVGQAAEVLTEEEFKKLKPKLDELKLPYVKQTQTRWRQAFVAGGTELDSGPCPFPFGPTFKFMTYKRDRNQNTWYGLVRAMIDPQRFGNKFFSQILDILNKGAKGGILAEKGAFDDPREAEKKWAMPDGIVWTKPGAIVQGKIKEKNVVQLPPSLSSLMTFSMDSVHEVTGINLELLGMAGRDQPGIIEGQRKQAGMTIIAPLFDALRRYRKEQGRVLLYFIQTYLSDGRLIRIGNETANPQYLPLIRDPNITKYDVIVDESPTSPNMKERVFAMLSQMMPAILQAGIPIPPEILDYSPLPSVLVQQWKQMIANAPRMNPKQLEEMQTQLKNAMKENHQLKMNTAEAVAKEQTKQQQNVTDYQIQKQKNENDLQLAREKLAGELAIQRERTLGLIQIERERMGMAADRAAAETINKIVTSNADNINPS